MIKALVVNYVKNNFSSLVGKLLKAVDWATLCAKAFQWLLDAAAKADCYVRVRETARKVAEQALVVLQVTEDGKVEPGEVKAASDLLAAWWEKKGKEITAPLEAAVGGLIDGGDE